MDKRPTHDERVRKKGISHNIDLNEIKIRVEERQDFNKIDELLKIAFPKEDVNDLVRDLRESENYLPSIAFVAEKRENETQISGYIMYTKASMLIGDEEQTILILSPLAILPEYQNQGLGIHLTRYSLDICRKKGYNFVNVLGHPRYYPRFGFVPAFELGISCSMPIDVPKAFMILDLQDESLNDLKEKLLSVNSNYGDFKANIVYPSEFEDHA